MAALVNSWLTGLSKATTLETSRLLLRAISAGDAEHIQQALNDTKVSEQLSYTPHPYTIEMAETWVKNVNFGMDRGNCCYWTICEKSTNSFVGSVGLSLFPDQDNAELHYWLASPFWGKGYCTESCKRVISYVFEELKAYRLQVTHRKNNDASKSVIAKCGFIMEGELRGSLKRFGKYENVIYYGLIRDEYFKLKEQGKFAV